MMIACLLQTQERIWVEAAPVFQHLPFRLFLVNGTGTRYGEINADQWCVVILVKGETGIVFSPPAATPDRAEENAKLMIRMKGLKTIERAKDLWASRL